MCDTVVATGAVTADGSTIFGKNSDREPNEAHHLLHVPAADHPAGSQVPCTYITIPQAAHTHAVLLAKPFWMWGAEMGVNEHGVAIGNEAVFTKIPYEKGRALTGMDLLRLALERSTTAREALAIITTLLAAHGQGGNCGFTHKFYYHNSFIIADPHDAWVLETAGFHWAAKQIKGVYTISNGITIGSEWDLASPDLVRHAIDKGWCKSAADFHFARCYSDTLFTRFSDCTNRCQRTTDLLTQQRGHITPQTVMAALRDHQRSGTTAPDKGLTGASVCMHAGFGPVRNSQTTGSLVSHLHSDHPTHFVTATAAPCTSLFKPVWLDVGLPDTGPVPNGNYDEATLFWQHEALHRATLRDYALRHPLYASDRDALEAQFTAEALACADASAADRRAFSNQCFAQANAAEAEWCSRVTQTAPQQPPSWHFRRAWNGFNRAANLPTS